MTSDSNPIHYRGYTLRPFEDYWKVWKGNVVVATCNTAWSCMVWVDETLSP